MMMMDVSANTSERSMSMKWYVVHTYSGHENKARLSLQERVKQMGKDAQFGQILIPTESVLEMVKGQRRTTTRKFYPGYMFVQMELNEETFHLVKNTPKITGFLGGQNPTPVKESEISPDALDEFLARYNRGMFYEGYWEHGRPGYKYRSRGKIMRRLLPLVKGEK